MKDDILERVRKRAKDGREYAISSDPNPEVVAWYLLSIVEMIDREIKPSLEDKASKVMHQTFSDVASDLKFNANVAVVIGRMYKGEALRFVYDRVSHPGGDQEWRLGRSYIDKKVAEYMVRKGIVYETEDTGTTIIYQLRKYDG